MAVALLAGCADRADATVPSVVQASAGAVGFETSRCRGFGKNFQELAACERADGTLESFSTHNIEWRVRYFVRYWQMPCNEMPTVDEGYVYHMVTNDLYHDSDLSNKQRMAIRDAMFDGRVECK